MEKRRMNKPHSAKKPHAFVGGFFDGLVSPVFLFTPMPLGGSSDPGNIAVAARGVSHLMRDTFRETMKNEATRSKTA